MDQFLVSVVVLIALTIGAVVLLKKFFFKTKKPSELFDENSSDFDKALMTKDPDIAIYGHRNYYTAVAGFITMIFIFIFVEYKTVIEKLEEKLDPKAVQTQVQEIEITEQEPEKPKVKQNKPKREEIAEEEPEIDSTDKEELVILEPIFEDEEEEEEEEEEYIPPIVERADVRAEFPGGRMALMKWAYNNIKIPEADKQAGVRGMVMVSFIVYEDGKVRDVEIVRGLSPGIDQAVKNLMKNSPRWNPPTVQGQKVRERWRYPIKIAPK